MTDQKIEIRQQVNFASGKARIQKSSFLLLATVAKLLTLHPLIARVRVEGHTDDRGNAQKNLKLSQQRAEAVRDHLVQVNGVEATRLDAIGFGSTHPLAPNLTQKARAQNRRVEFIIVEKVGPPPPP